MRAYDVIVIGGGHAGIEAAHASSRMGLSTLLITMNIDTIGRMSCNPAIGGLAKGHVVVELDALGGLMPRIADQCAIQYRLLNRSKGPAVRAIRAQEDRERYARLIKEALFTLPHLTVFQGMVEGLIVKGGRVKGVVVTGVGEIPSHAVVVTTGTFLRGRVHIGQDSFPSGRNHEPPSLKLSQNLKEWGFTLKRLKTGTSPRVDKKSVDFTSLEPQPSEPDCPFFSFFTKERVLPQLPCWITYTNEKVHTIIRENLHRSAMYSGNIEGIGPRYCPSIEDKVVRFPDKPRHQVFLEPEGVDNPEIYLNGVSTNMPYEVQVAMVRAIPGLERAVIVRPGYAVEYDAIDATKLTHTLESKEIRGLFFAGQINGTSGYEEAAGQGWVAGVNAACYVQGREPVILHREEGYIGVMVDDLVTRGTDEPYRLFTSRAEYRLSLGFQTAYGRLAPKAYALGLWEEDAYKRIMEREEKSLRLAEQIEGFKVTPSKENQKKLAETLGISLQQVTTLGNLYRQTRYPLKDLAALCHFPLPEDGDGERVAYEVLYRPYQELARKQREEMKEWEDLSIPPNYSFSNIPGLSREMAERLERAQPKTLREARTIPGITPAALTVLYVHLRQHTSS